MPAFGVSKGAQLGHALEGMEAGIDRSREREVVQASTGH